ncbi:hypothetical protein PG994_010710 [Apiospora phragmitis]|uniref:RING zinc finger-like domain-containing protein n=1 Tax=Apiospora phragmitis TaxID=2905665 RepID=A0ABR1TT01_9PEZI
MPPRSSLTSSFSIADSTNEVVCPLRNQDGSSCRKRCLGEKRFRSMQEHIRRAHPEHYISKLPATEESFNLMVNTPPQDRSQFPQNQSAGSSQPQHNNNNRTPGSAPGSGDPIRGYPLDPRISYSHDDPNTAPETPRRAEDYSNGLLPTANAAAALAQLGQMHKLEPDWDSGEVYNTPHVSADSHLIDPSLQDWHSDNDARRIPRTTIELPPIQVDHPSDSFPSLNSSARQQMDLLPSILSNSPPGRSSTLPPLHRSLGPNRPRKQSVTKRHKKQKSRGTASDWLRRIQNDERSKLGVVGGIDRKAHSVEPTADYGKRWENLIDAAASATEDIEDDRTPVPQSPISIHQTSLPPFPQQSFPGYQASPLQQALTPPSFAQEVPEPFPSVESGEAGDNFHIGAAGLSDSSPSYSAQDVHIYCAACQRASRLKESYACTECICGLCRECVNVLMEEQGARRKCPRCATIGGRFKPFQLEIR